MGLFEIFKKKNKPKLSPVAPDAAYGEYPDILQTHSHPDDHMESWFPAETIKYLYLLFSPSNVLDLEKVVFNTECHPLTVF